MGILSPTKKVIQTQRNYTVDEVCDILKQRGGLPFEPEIKNFLGIRAIYIKGDHTDDVLITVKQNKITVTHKERASAGNIAGKAISRGLGGAGGALIGAAIGTGANAVKGDFKIGAEWSAIIGNGIATIGDITLFVADRLEGLMNGAASFPAHMPPQAPMPASVQAAAPYAPNGAQVTQPESKFPRGLLIWCIICIVLQAIFGIVFLMAGNIFLFILTTCGITGFSFILQKKKFGLYIVCAFAVVTFITNIASGGSVNVIGLVNPVITWLLMRKNWEIFRKPAAVQAPVQAPVPAPVYAPPVTMPAQAQASGVLCTNGYFAGVTFPINGRLLIGRDPNFSQVIFPLDTAGISALHCEVSQSPAGIVLTDKGSTYGTFLLDGRRINANENVALSRGDGFYLTNRQNTFQIV